MTTQIAVINSPILSATLSEVAENTAFKNAILARRATRMAFWMESMGDDLLPIMARLRASELSAKADGDFIEERSSHVTASYREMVMTRAGKFEELTSPARVLIEENEISDFDEISDGEIEENEYAIE